MGNARYAWLATGLAAMACANASAADTIRYVALVDGGQRAGHQVVRHHDDGSVTVDFRFEDNGRGPELQERYTLGKDGTYQRYSVTGTATSGAIVDETFSREGDRVQWTTTSDQGAMTVDGTGLYLPLGGTPASFSVAMAALARDEDGAVALLPHGTLRMREVATVEIRQGRKHQVVQLLALTGIGLKPTFAWATTGARPRLFAYIVPGDVQLIEAGWELSAAALESRQVRAEDEDLMALQQDLAHTFEGALLFDNARVFDSEHAVPGPLSDVRVADGRIVEVVPDPEGRPAKRIEGLWVVHANGGTLLPGLFDGDAHLDPWDGGLRLAAGVTTVRGVGNDDATQQRLMRQGEAGRLMLPRVVPKARNGDVGASLQEAAAGLDPASPEVRSGIALLASQGVVVVPRLAAFESMHQRDGTPPASVASVAAHLPPAVERSHRAAEGTPETSPDRTLAESIAFTGLMHDAGVTIVPGTDGMAGFTLQRELELFVEAGMTPGEALRTATWNAAKVAGVLDDRGSIEPGKRADLILVDGDPTADIAAIRNVATVLKGDTLYYPARIHEALGVAPFTRPAKAMPPPEIERERRDDEQPDEDSRDLPGWIYG